MSLLAIRDLRVRFGPAPAVDGLDLDVDAGEVLGIVGESGSGKSVAMMALLGLVDAPGRVEAASLHFDGHDLRDAGVRRRVVGREIAIVFQDASASLNPAWTIGMQLKEPLRLHL
ncbi:MAG: ABC transporter ATP-binding protein, partial [Burkholderiales bacterium]|nr:ABC transporter ATP-binding protein [Burkholderiales bacterium]